MQHFFDLAYIFTAANFAMSPSFLNTRRCNWSKCFCSNWEIVDCHLFHSFMPLYATAPSDDHCQRRQLEYP
jgi:hypothetical protein